MAPDVSDASPPVPSVGHQPQGDVSRASLTETEAGTGTPDSAQKRSSHDTRWRRWHLRWVIFVVLVLGVAITVRVFFVETFYVPSQSMQPTIMAHDTILVDTFSYHIHAPHIGDIVVFAKPPHTVELGSNVQDLVKRIVGLPGQTIASGPHGDVYVNCTPGPRRCRPIPQPWLSPAARADPGPRIVPIKIPAGEYFVLGDNRGDSEDSRTFGPISGKLIVGDVIMRVWPLSALHWF